MTVPTVGAMFWAFFRTGACGFGGALPWVRRMLVEERVWLTAQEFTDIFSVSNFLPGPNVLNVTVIVGSRFHGVPGALAAVLGLIALPLVVVLVLAALYARFGQVPGIDAILHGLGAAVAGLVIATALKMAGSLLRSPRFVGFLAVTFGAIALLRWPLIPVLLGFASVSVLAAWFKRA